MDDLNTKQIFDKATASLANHNKFLLSTAKNISYYFFGKDVPLAKHMTYPQIDLVSVLQGYVPEPYNPMAFFVSAFINELANSDFSLSVDPFPVGKREPYDSFADQLEDYLLSIHRKSKRQLFKKAIVFELLAHGYFGIYTNGYRYWFLSAFDLIPADQTISLPEDQPYWIRRTSASRKLLETIPGFEKSKESTASDLDVIPLLDVWIKPLDINVLYTASGQFLWKQRFPYPKRYPFFVGRVSDLMNNFYTKPLLSSLRSLLPKYQKAVTNIEEHAKSVANPILTYDADAGIDVNMLQRALMEGWKRIIIGKNREGDLNFKAPGHLPAYALQYPEFLSKAMQHHLGISDAFLGMPTKAIRERGAIGAFMGTSFRMLRTYARIIEDTFSDLNNYLIDFLIEHRHFVFRDKFKNIEEYLNPGVRYVAEERIKGFWSEDTKESRTETITKRARRLIPREQALRELGYNKPRRLIEKLKEEELEDARIKAELQNQVSAKPKGTLQEIVGRLRGQLKNRYYIYPFDNDKFLIKCSKIDKDLVSFLLSDFADAVKIEPIVIYKKPTPEQSLSEKSQAEPKPETEPTAEVPQIEESQKTAAKQALSSFKKEPVPARERSSSPPFSEDMIRKLIKRSTILKHPEKFFNLPGMYLVEPHASWIASGKKTALLKSRKFNVVDKPYLLCGKDKVYGVIIIRYILEDFDVDKTEKFHLVSKAQQKNWWKNKNLYLYLFEFHPFKTPLEYDRPDGVQTFIKHVKFKDEEIGLPFTGDLKPVLIKPGTIPPVHKPEKKAFQPHEVFNVDRLQQILPEAVYDVSYKVDGIRTYAWIINGRAVIYSDTGHEISKFRVQPILEALPKVFKKTCLVDGELVMEGIRRKDIAGYIHGQWKPTPDELKSLRYKCWDMLYVNDKSLASKPFRVRSSILDLFIKKGCKEKVICRVPHMVVPRNQVPQALKKVTSKEGAVIRDIEASYWATHATYKCKYTFDVDARVIAVKKTKVGLPIFQCVLKDGTYIGQTYAQAEVNAKPGDVIRVNVEHVSIRPDGSIGWYAPRPKSWKEGKITPAKQSLMQVGIGGPDNIDLIKEIYLSTGGTQEKWDAWYPKFLAWKKGKMQEIIKKLKNA